MSSRLIKDWEQNNRSNFLNKLGGRLNQGSTLKEKVAHSVYRLKTLRNKLDHTTSRIQTHDKKLFNKCVESQLSKDQARAIMYANECAELRKMVKIALGCQMALEKVTLRLETVKQFGDIATLMQPVSSVIHQIKNQISGLMPEVSFELNEICGSLDQIAMEFGETVGSEDLTITQSEDAQRIITEANAIAEQTLKDKFPELPQTMPTPEKELT